MITYPNSLSNEDKIKQSYIEHREISLQNFIFKLMVNLENYQGWIVLRITSKSKFFHPFSPEHLFFPPTKRMNKTLKFFRLNIPYFFGKIYFHKGEGNDFAKKYINTPEYYFQLTCPSWMNDLPITVNSRL